MFTRPCSSAFSKMFVSAWMTCPLACKYDNFLKFEHTNMYLRSIKNKAILILPKNKMKKCFSQSVITDVDRCSSHSMWVSPGIQGSILFGSRTKSSDESSMNTFLKSSSASCRSGQGTEATYPFQRLSASEHLRSSSQRKSTPLTRS